MATPYEQQLISQYGSGMSDYINQQRALGKSGLLKGVNVDPQDVAGLTSGYSALQTAGKTTTPATYTFDVNQYLPTIQKQAASIYDPQMAQIKALQQISQNQAAQTKITTEKQFQDELTARIEAINARGAFFGGGALQNQADIEQRKTQALTNLDLQQQAAEAQAQGQLGALSAAEAQYIQEKLTGAEGSAYSRFIDERNYQLQLKNMAQEQANADREYQLELKRIKNDEKATAAQKKAAKKAAKTQKEQFDAELKYKYASLSKSSSGSSGVDTNIY